MTAEIAILNRAAVALAADSAVTIAATTSNGHTEKVYKTANKLFALSKYHPVGIMIYGNASMLGVPWETIIKSFSRQLHHTSYPTVSEYAEAFWTYLEQHVSEFFPSIQQEKWIEGISIGQYQALQEKINSRIQNDLVARGQTTESRIKRIASEVIFDAYTFWNQSARLSGFDQSTTIKLLRTYHSVMERAKKAIFGRFPLTQKASKMLNQIVAQIVVTDVFGSGHSGIVVAGFGDKEIFPSMKSFIIDGVALDHLKYKLAQSYDVSFENGAGIAPFAQDDMVYLFMEGTDRDYHRFKLKCLKDIFLKLPEHITSSSPLSDEDKKQWRQKLDSVMESLYDSFVKDMDRYRGENYIDPIMHVVALMPKDELAIMAETLVNLTAFRRKINMVTESVGEPIDVAVITKGDGLVWIKRKQYFQADINHSFFANYLD